MVHNIRTKDEFQDALKNYSVVVVDFYSTHAAESKNIAPTFAHANELDKFKDFRFLKIDIDDLKGLAEELGVSKPASFQMYKNGEKINDLQSDQTEDLIQFLETVHCPEEDKETKHAELERLSITLGLNVVLVRLLRSPVDSQQLDHATCSIGDTGADPQENGDDDDEGPPAVAEKAAITLEDVEKQETLGIGGKEDVELKGEAHDGNEGEDGVQGSVILLLLGLADGDPPVQRDGEDTGDTSQAVGLGEDLVVELGSDGSDTHDDTDIDDETIKAKTKLPLVEIPLNSEDDVQGVKDPLKDRRPQHSTRADGSRDGNLTHEGPGVIVVLGADGEEGVDDEEPEADEGSEVVEHVISVHEERQGDTKQVKTQKNSSDALE
ncbi:hypothetical protein HG531_009061 [Fusarium graminearum]|nr:hypothetical protein HG531_009061 [Fusarium graminearum]